MVNYRLAEEKDLNEISRISAQAYKNYCFFKETLGKEFNNETKYEEFLCKLFYVWAKANIKRQLCIVAIYKEKVIGYKNKEYSLEHCMFVPESINHMVAKRSNRRGDCPIGVSRKVNKFRETINIKNIKISKNLKNKYNSTHGQILLGVFCKNISVI